MNSVEPVAIDVRHWSLAGEEPQRLQLFSTMSGEERQRAARFHDPADANAYVWARGGLRSILAERAGCRPEGLEFVYGPNGKPTLAGPAGNLHFNLSHSGGIAVCAISASHPVGVDIEVPRPIESDVARHFFSAAENRDLDSLRGEHWRQGFFNCWVRKESIVKAIGLGLSFDLKCFDVSLIPGEPARVQRFAGDHGAAEQWHLADLSVESGMAGALAVRSHGVPVTINVRRWR